MQPTRHFMPPTRPPNEAKRRNLQGRTGAAYRNLSGAWLFLGGETRGFEPAPGQFAQHNPAARLDPGMEIIGPAALAGGSRCDDQLMGDAAPQQ